METSWREVEDDAEATKYLMTFTTKIQKKLSWPQLRSYFELMEDFRANRIGRSELVRGILPLFEDSEELLQMFLKVVPVKFLPNGTDDGDDDRDEEDEEDEEELEEGEIREGVDYYDNYHNDDYNHDYNYDPNNQDDIDEFEDGEIQEGLDYDYNDDGLIDGHNNDHRYVDHNDDRDNEEAEKLSAKDMEIIRRAARFHNKIFKISEGVYKEFLLVFTLHKDGLIDGYELKDKMVSILSGHENLIEEFHQILPDVELNALDEAVPAGKSNGTETKSKSTKDIDLNTLQKITPSYRLIPEEYQMAVRDQVLNNQCVSMGNTTSDEYIYRRPSMKEKMMNDREDDIFEADMLQSAMENAVITAKEVLVGKKEMRDVGRTFNRCIERIYGDYGEEIVRVMEKEPLRALPAILPRLQQKLGELITARGHWNTVWIESLVEKKSKDGSELTAKENNSKEM